MNRWKLNPAQQAGVFMSPCLTMRTDIMATVTEVHGDTLTLFGRTSEDVVGKSAYALVDPSVPLVDVDTPSGKAFDFWVELNYVDRIRKGETLYHELDFVMGDTGELKSLACTARGEFSSDGSMYGFRLGFCDLEEVRRDIPVADPTEELRLAFETALGGRLRSRAAANLKASMDAMRDDSGGTIVVRVPPSRTSPVEITFWSYEGTVTFEETI